MTIEEITLSVPQSLEHNGNRRSAAVCEPIDPSERTVRRYRGILQERHRFAWTRRRRDRQRDAYEVAYRSLVKQLAREVTDPILDRTVRLDTRTRIYGSMTGLLAVAATEQRSLRERSLRLLGWGLGLCFVGLGSLAASIFVAS